MYKLVVLPNLIKIIYLFEFVDGIFVHFKLFYDKYRWFILTSFFSILITEKGNQRDIWVMEKIVIISAFSLITLLSSLFFDAQPHFGKDALPRFGKIGSPLLRSFLCKGWNYVFNILFSPLSRQTLCYFSYTKL